jgi:carbon monoxide dehydrogenase subunit G
MHLLLTQDIDAAPENVFARATDLSLWEADIGGVNKVEVLTDGPVGLGTRFRETRTMFGKEATEEMEVTDFQPGRSWTLEAASCGAHYTTQIRFVPTGGGTRLEWEMTSRSVSLAAKMFGWIGCLFIGSMKKIMAKDLVDLKNACEGMALQSA